MSILATIIYFIIAILLATYWKMDIPEHPKTAVVLSLLWPITLPITLALNGVDYSSNWILAKKNKKSSINENKQRSTE